MVSCGSGSGCLYICIPTDYIDKVEHTYNIYLILHHSSCYKRTQITHTYNIDYTYNIESADL
jgi:hypothetical protein